MKFAATIFALVGMTQFAYATTYAQFCDDQECSVNCGESVSTDNPGCLSESGRGSIKFHDINIQEVNLVSSPDSACSCQNNCNYQVVRDLDSSNPCFHITGPTANSFRFVGDQVCDPNNC